MNPWKFISKYFWDLLFVALSIILIVSLSGCITRKEIEANIWLNNGLDVSLCGQSKATSKHPELWDYGVYRKLDSGKFELVPYCARDEMGKPYITDFVSVHKEDLRRILDATLPENSED